MRNVYISISIFLIMIVIMGFSLNYLNKTCTTLETKTDKLEHLLNDEKWSEAYDLSNNLFKEWKKQSEIMPVFANHAEIDAMNNEILKLTQYVKCKNKEESLASTHVLKFYLDNIKALQKINFQNVL